MRNNPTTKQYIIYKIERRATGEKYVGQTKNKLKVRIAAHLGKKSGQKLYLVQRALAKHGVEAFDITVIDTSATSPEELDDLEIYWIKFYNSLAPNGYNLTTGGRGWECLSAEVRERMIESHLTMDPEDYARRKALRAECYTIQEAAIRLGLSYGDNRINGTLEHYGIKPAGYAGMWVGFGKLFYKTEVDKLGDLFDRTYSTYQVGKMLKDAGIDTKAYAASGFLRRLNVHNVAESPLRYLKTEIDTVVATEALEQVKYVSIHEATELFSKYTASVSAYLRRRGIQLVRGRGYLKDSCVALAKRLSEIHDATMSTSEAVVVLGEPVPLNRIRPVEELKDGQRVRYYRTEIEAIKIALAAEAIDLVDVHEVWERFGINHKGGAFRYWREKYGIKPVTIGTTNIRYRCSDIERLASALTVA